MSEVEDEKLAEHRGEHNDKRQAKHHKEKKDIRNPGKRIELTAVINSLSE